MKKFIFFLLVITCALNYSSFAKSTDTIVVKNTGINALVNTIAADTVSDGLRINLHRVYILKRGERYINSKTIIYKGYDLHISGEKAPLSGTDPGPAVIQLAPDSFRFLLGDRITDRIIEAHGNLYLSDVWILSWVAKGAQLWEPLVEMKDSSVVRLNNCIFEWQEGPAIYITGKYTNVFLTNNMFRNAIYKDEIWAGRVIYYRVPADTLVEINNTVENVGFGLLQSQGIGLNYYICDHNTVVNCAKFNWLESWYKKAYIANNLLVNCHFSGERMKDCQYQDPNSLLYGQTINLDTLKTPGKRITYEEAIKMFGTDAVQFIDQKTLSASDPQELSRIVVYCNNISYFDTTLFYPFYKKYNDTVPVPERRILPEPVTNPRTQSMWGWHPYMINKDCTDGVNPDFKFMPQNRNEIIEFLSDMYSAVPKNYVFWGYDPDSKDPSEARNKTTVYPNSSKGIYPTKEDFSYSNRQILQSGLNGYPAGDLNWFPEKMKTWNFYKDFSLMRSMFATGKKF